ncbi:triphosphoribosyl-dephospho-CoA synthase [uncultured Ilyobacter sp.]|uniref:triphosphoribosyl-dephospho-CoA synthase n=1 Tax=uncultured Ilyobacter sp. TaxID=544433 RepID=UPI0029C889FA|nr:triphosphoribosyl-dephospho-CoA synthase [uncultured Ilyobacter sp.]
MYREEVYKLVELLQEAMLKEVMCYPSFGLVSPISNGSHNDMDHFTFIESTVVLQKYFLRMANLIFLYEDEKIIFNYGRKIGIEAEMEMFKKTGGVNTHKGMIFLLGITLMASGIVILKGGKFEDISNVIKNMTMGIVENDFRKIDSKQTLTHGEKIYLEYGITGVRREVETGLPLVFEYSLNTYENLKLNQNQRLVYTLLEIMSMCDDTTVLYRHDIKMLDYVKKRSQEILENTNGYFDQEILDNFTEECIEKNISPGGAADILATTVFLSLVKQEFFNCKNL